MTVVLEITLGVRLEEMASFRNRLVNGYLELDPERIYNTARSELGDIEAFVMSIVTRYLPDAAS